METAGLVRMVRALLRQLAPAAIVLCSSTAATGQSVDVEFDVASIKRNTSPRLPPLDVVSRTLTKRAAASARNGRFTMQGLGAAPLIVLIQAAYSVKEFQIFGAPSWAFSDRDDVDARSEAASTFEQMRPMLQSLLAGRFRLTFHREIRQLPVYDLVPAGNGLKITPLRNGDCVPQDQAKPFGPLNVCGGIRRQRGAAAEQRDVVEAVSVSMPTLIDFVSDEVGRAVLDKSDFTEPFSFRLEFASDLASGLLNGVTPAASSSSGVSIFTALEEQLGLRLRSATGPVEVLVIDHVERPSPN